MPVMYSREQSIRMSFLWFLGCLPIPLQCMGKYAPFHEFSQFCVHVSLTMPPSDFRNHSKDRLRLPSPKVTPSIRSTYRTVKWPFEIHVHHHRVNAAPLGDTLVMRDTALTVQVPIHVYINATVVVTTSRASPSISTSPIVYEYG